MPYSTASDIYSTKIYNFTSTDVPTTTVTLFISDADSLIDGYVAKQYSLPFGATPPLIFKLSKDLAAYYCLDFLYSQENQNVNDWVIKKYEDALVTLQDISEDKIRLNYSAGTMATMLVAGMMATNLEDIPLAFNVDHILNQSVPDNLLIMIDNDRDSAE